MSQGSIQDSGFVNWKNGVATYRDGISVGEAELGRKMKNWALDVEFETPMKQLLSYIWGPKVKLLRAGPGRSRWPAAYPVC